MKVAFKMDSGQPNIKLVKDNAVRQSHGAKEFRLGEFKEANVRAIKNNTCGIDVAPADAFFDGEFLQ